MSEIKEVPGHKHDQKEDEPDIGHLPEHARNEVEGHGHDGSRQAERQQTAIGKRVADEEAVMP